MRWLSRLAAADAVPVFPVVGENGLAAAENLFLDPRLRPVPSPRHARVLLVLGETGQTLNRQLRRLHDQLSHPRATLWCDAVPDPDFGRATESSDTADAVVEAYRSMFAGAMDTEPDIHPNEPPNEWRGKGTNGQGGDGMMGGTPYGRPMAMTDDDLRDGLQLDAYSATFGPFLPAFPPGLALDITLQGDSIQAVSVSHPPFRQETDHSRTGSLRNLARLLRVLGVPALAARFIAAARKLEDGGTIDLDVLARAFDWSGAMHIIPSDLGSFGGEGRDVRSRVRAWLNIARGRQEPAPLGQPALSFVDLVKGLEWYEAVIVLNSFDNNALRNLCPVENTDDQTEEAPQ